LIKLVDFGLVKILASEELTITILQGRGTALYTPLEQYGGDT
jgi:serine/threonine-protein kinase